MSEDEPSRGRSSKVARVIEEYQLSGLGAELEAAWTAPESERRSLRELADHVNRQIVEAALTRGGERPLEGEIQTVSAALAGDTDSATERDVRTRLEERGVNVDQLEDDLVSYQAVRTYLQNVRGAEYEPAVADPVQRTRDRIQGLRGRLRAVASSQLDSLAESGEITMDDSRVLVQVQVYCEDCGRQFDIEELLDRGGCNCD
ncbi:rod-determining factor RdfA [Halodesulfurarchaeum formicicum]|uniref:Uncharacterized protein n=1 Tax=Halodesulfurarchaeum formicicum TaxID=1873524 RepID=A0A1J1AF52_9EURY|nr:rod-determining factor RdfA [Halodesulfurarchaeum formicicum]APE96225.1 hypothetical protein HSR6_1788 [Halodesulfurarchaeum formicicum]